MQSKSDPSANVPINCTIPIEQYRWIKATNTSPSELLRAAIKERMGAAHSVNGTPNGSNSPPAV